VPPRRCEEHDVTDRAVPGEPAPEPDRPPATEPPATEPPVNELPANELPATEPPANEPPAGLPPGPDGLPPAAYPPGTTPARPGGVTMPVAVPVGVALVLGLLLGLVLGWLLPRPGSGDESASADPAPATAAATPAPTGAAQRPTELSPSAPQPIPGGPGGTEEVAGLVLGTQGPLVELFEDYVCPFCARLEASSGARLRQGALDGEYRLVVHPIAFLTEDSPRAANASACVYANADEATWVAFHESVYASQDPTEAVGQFSTEVLLGLATTAGATAPEVSACIQDGTYVEWVGALTEQAFQRGVRGTPTLAVEGRITDVSSLTP
jgi:protein-disulfide isomerase